MSGTYALFFRITINMSSKGETLNNSFSKNSDYNVTETYNRSIKIFKKPIKSKL